MNNEMQRCLEAGEAGVQNYDAVPAGHCHRYIAPSARIGEKTTIGLNTVIMDDVIIGTNCEIGCNVVIHRGTVIGNDVRIDDNTVIGKQPMRAPNSAIPPATGLGPTKIGNRCLIGACAVIYYGATIGEKVLVADLASIREKVTIGDYTIVGRGAYVENYCDIGSYVKLEANSYITAYSSVGDYCFVAPCVTTTNDNFMARSEERFKHFKGVTMKKGARIGGNAVIMPGIVIEEDGVVGAGSVVTRDVPARKIVVGVPARVLKDVPADQLLENQPPRNK